MKKIIMMVCVLQLLLPLLLSSVSADINTGIVDVWTMDNAKTSGTNCINSLTGKNGTISGSAVTGITGKVGQAYKYVGGGGGGTVTFTGLSIPTTYSLGLWLNTSSSQPAAFLFFRVAFFISITYVTSTSSFDWYVGDGGASWDGGGGATISLKDNKYHFFVFSYNVTTKKKMIWVDGKNLWNATSSKTASATAANYALAQDGLLVGGIDEFTIWGNHVLNITEVRCLNSTPQTYPYSCGGGAPPAVTSNLSVFFLNASSLLKKAVFQESENFRVYANHSLSNGSILINSLCNVTVPQGTLEYADPEQLFSVCSVACDFTSYAYNRTGLKVTNALKDVLHFSACHLSAIQNNLSVNVCGTVYSLGAAQMPLCATGSSQFFLNSSLCKTKAYADYSFSNGVLQGHRVQGLNLDRVYSKLVLPMPYNVTRKAYRSNRSVEYYQHGGYALNVTCNGSFNNFRSRSVTVVNKAPSVNLNEIHTNSDIYDLINNLKIEYKSGVWSWFASVVDDDLDTAIFTFKNSTSILQRTVTKIPGTIYTPEALFVQAGKVYNFSVFVNDSLKNRTYRSMTFSINDTSLPVCGPLLNHTVMNNTLWVWNVTCMDDYFFSFNLSCDNGFRYSKADIDNTSFAFVNSSRLKDAVSVSCDYEFCDGHTAEAIGEFRTVTDVARSTFAVDGVPLVLSEPVKAITLVKRVDRYSFCYDFGLSKAEYVAVTVPYGCYPASNSQWPGHLVCPEKRLWIDFVNVDVKAAVAGDEVLLDLRQVKDRANVCFESVGRFNCVSGRQLFNISYPVVPKPNEFQTTGQALWFFFLSLLWLVFLFGTITLKGPHGKHMLILNFAQMGLAVFLAADLINKFAIQFVAAIIFMVGIGFFVGMIFYEVKWSR